MAKVAKMQIREERIHGRRAMAGKEAKGKRRVAREVTVHGGLAFFFKGHVAVWSRKGGPQQQIVCSPLMKMRAKTLKKHLTMLKSCKRGVC